MVTRVFQVRIRDAERSNRAAVGLQNTHLQETLAGMEVIHALGREDAFVARFRQALRQGLIAFNRAAVYTALITALILWVGAGGLLASWGVSLGTLTAFVLLYRASFCRSRLSVSSGRPCRPRSRDWSASSMCSLSRPNRLHPPTR